jgi:hypothetical protein
VPETALADPALLVDQDAMHHRDLAGGTAETEGGDAAPGPRRLSERWTTPAQALARA